MLEKFIKEPSKDDQLNLQAEGFMELYEYFRPLSKIYHTDNILLVLPELNRVPEQDSLVE